MGADSGECDSSSSSGSGGGSRVQGLGLRVEG